MDALITEVQTIHSLTLRCVSQRLPTVLMNKCGPIDYFIETIDPEPIDPRWCVLSILMKSV